MISIFFFHLPIRTDHGITIQLFPVRQNVRHMLFTSNKANCILHFDLTQLAEEQRKVLLCPSL